MEHDKDPFVKDETFGCSSCRYSCDYRDHIGQGAFGTVYKAANRPAITGRLFGSRTCGDFLAAKHVAVKVIHLDRQSELLTDRTKWTKLRERLKHLREFTDDHLVRYHRVIVIKGSHGGVSIELMMDYHDGGDLKTLIQNLRRQRTLMNETTSLSYTIQIAEGLRYLHDKHIIHGDLKPGNILTTLSENGDRKLAICDLDDIVQMERDATCSHDITQLRGTVRYLSPEMMKKFIATEDSKTPGRKTDIWSLGCIMLELADCVVGNDRKWLRKGQQNIEVGNKVNDERFIQLIVDGFVPCAVETIASCLTVNAQQCLHTESSERISASSLIQHLKPKELVMIFCYSNSDEPCECYLFDPSTQTLTELALPMELTEARFHTGLAVSNGSVLYQRTQVRGAFSRTDLDVEVLKWDVQKQAPPTVFFREIEKCFFFPIAVMDKIYFWCVDGTLVPQLRTLDLRDGKDKILKQPAKKNRLYGFELYRARDGNRIIFIGHQRSWSGKPSLWVECFDTVTGEWESLPDLPRWRSGFAMVVLQKAVYVLGGHDYDTKSKLRSCMRLDLQSSTRQWETMRDLLEERRGHCAFVSDNRIYVVGGQRQEADASKFMEAYDTEQDVWSAVSVKGGSRILDGKSCWCKAFDITLSWPLPARHSELSAV